METCKSVTKGLIIVNNAGGLVYSSMNGMNQNQMLVLGTTIYSLIEMLIHTTNINGYEKIVEYENVRIVVFKTLTNHLFIFLWDSTAPPFDMIYAHFCDVVLQDYSYSLEMPIGSERFTPERYF